MQQGILHFLVSLGLCVLLVCPVSVVSPQSFHYHFIREKKSWTHAQMYCRSKYSDLATISTTAEMQRATEAISNNTEGVWIGLNKTWGWSSTTGPKSVGYNNWGAKQPENDKPEKSCVVMQNDGKWVTMDCVQKQPYICYKQTKLLGRLYFMIHTKSTWSEARSQCRSSYTDLAFLTNGWENFYAQQTMGGESTAWTGLSRNTWCWSDRNPSTFRNWLSVESSEPGQSGALMNPGASFKWEEEICSTTLPFLCYEDDQQMSAVTGVKQVLSLEVQTDQNVNDPQVQEDILVKIQKQLRDLGLEANITLAWRHQPDGNVFQKKKNAMQDEL